MQIEEKLDLHLYNKLKWHMQRLKEETLQHSPWADN